jgi:hypothetical protein
MSTPQRTSPFPQPTAIPLELFGSMLVPIPFGAAGKLWVRLAGWIQPGAVGSCGRFG